MAVLDADKLKEVISASGLRQSDFINRLDEVYDIRKDTSRSWLRGTRNPRDEAINQMAQLLDVDPKYIIKDELDNYEIPERIVAIPMFDTIQSIILDKDAEDEDVIQTIKLEATGHHNVISSNVLRNVFATRIMDGSNGPSVPNGSIVTWQFGLEALRNDSLVLVHQQFGVTYVKRVGINSGDIELYDLRDELRESPTKIGESERILGVVLQVDYRPISGSVL